MRLSDGPSAESAAEQRAGAGRRDAGRSDCALCGPYRKGSDSVNLRQAPRFQAYFHHLEGREVMVMSRHEWEQSSRLREGEMAQIALRPTPIAGVARDSRIEAAVLVRKSGVEVIVEVYRYDPVDMPLPINLDRYLVWERLPPHRDFLAMVNAASTEDNANMRGFLDDHVFFVKDVVRDGHHVPDLPEDVKALVRRGHTASY